MPEGYCALVLPRRDILPLDVTPAARECQSKYTISRESGQAHQARQKLSCLFFHKLSDSMAAFIQHLPAPSFADQIQALVHLTFKIV